MTYHEPHMTIPYTTEALLWVWDVPSDKLRLSLGAHTALALAPETPIRSMAEFLTHIPPACLPALHQLREEVLSNDSDTHLECVYPFRDKVVKEYIQVLSRDNVGRALQALGYLVIDKRNQDAYLDAAFGNTGMPATQDTRSDLTSNDKGMLLFAVNSTGDGLWDWDATNNHVYFSPRYLSMLGYTAEEFPGHLDFWAEKIHPDDRHKIIGPQADIAASPRYGDTFECTYRLQRKDGTYAWILGRGYVTHRDSMGCATRIVGMHADITQVQGERDKLEELVKNDTLTGLRSRSFCDLEVERLDKNKIRPVCVLSVDITGLKLVNDEMGHAMGDKLLTATATLLREPLRATDCVARMGGDEFIILLPGCSQERGTELVTRIQDCLTRHNQEANEFPIYAAIGMAYAGDTSTSVAALLRQADINMLKNKKSQRITALRTLKRWIETRLGTTVTLRDVRVDT